LVGIEARRRRTSRRRANPSTIWSCPTIWPGSL